MNFGNIKKSLEELKIIEYHSLTFPAFIYNLDLLHREYDKIIIVAENSSVVKSILDSIRQNDINVFEYPEQEIVLFDSYIRSREIDKVRLKTIYSIMSSNRYIVVTTPQALLSPLPPMKSYIDKSLKLSMGSKLEMNFFIEKLVQYGYERNPIVSSVGEFSVRGGVVDVYPPASDMAIRVEFFGDEVDSIRKFSVETMISEENILDVEIRPASLGLIFDEDKASILKRLKNLAKKSDSNVHKSKYEMLEQKVCEVDGVKYNDLTCKNIPILYENYSNLFEYTNDSVFLYWNFNNINSQLINSRLSWEEEFSVDFLNNNVLQEQIDLVGDELKWIKSIEKSKNIFFNPLKYEGSSIYIDESIDFSFRDVNKYNKEVSMIVSDLKKWLSKKYEVIYTFGDQNRLDGFIQLLQDNSFDRFMCNIISNVYEAKIGFINLCVSSINRGFESDQFKKVIVSEYELYGRNIHSNVKQKRKKKDYNAFFDVEVGDYVVHKTYGIGKYLGIVQLKVDNKINDYVKISYKDEDLLYVEVEKMDLLTKYVGAEISTVRLSKLGTAQWNKTTSKVKKEVAEITEELVRLYSQRELGEGYSFSEDSEWQKDFEESFIHQETLDQIKAVEEIKYDMQSPRPMDRLLCGDVGYGKTEVALRAAFKAVNDSKQVAILVPTTILAQQHYNTMLKRFDGFPINIEMLSRFRNATQQKKIFKDVESGVIDILVGTHRILSKKLNFKDLGLLIIDEEQRFGVKHKEAIKEIKTNIDVLTLSATPIPRTLHMSLVGIRDMSLIEEPPEDRYPVQTYVLEYDERILRDAINRELRRKGQVYFVHNRIKDIDRIADKIREIVPEARVEFAHGQMDEKSLEKLMLSFMNGEFDVLVSTVIIETGLDIQNVNTIIINESYKLGLSQLYQLKGRVGRSNRVAYAYLFYNKNMILKEVSEKRLKAIGEFTELGAGFKIAMRDLEIRGAGNVLGAKQHGHVVSVGYELYTKMVEEAVDIYKNGGVEKKKIDTSVDIKCSAYIPDGYISDFRYKMDFYKKISSIKDSQDKLNLESELFDINGDIPQVVQNLINIAYIRALGIQCNIVDIRKVDDKIFLIYPEGTESVEAKSISEVMEKYRYGTLNFVGSTKPRFEYKSPKKLVVKSRLLEEIIELLQNIRLTLPE